MENLEDGTVKIVCEGEEPKIEEFIRDIKVKIIKFTEERKAKIQEAQERQKR